MSVSAAGYASAGGLAWVSIRRIGRMGRAEEQVPRAAVLSAAFFVASWVHVPLPPTSVHLVLNGLMGVMLGWFAFPAILVGLALQAVMFGHGGITTLGVNATVIGAGALAAHFLFRLLSNPRSRRRILIAGVIGGSAGIMISASALAVLLIATLPAHLDAGAERAAIGLMVSAHIPVALIEGIMTGLVAVFILRVKPSILCPSLVGGSPVE
jgi:cobalt/nickel transport system permease protein